MYSQSTLPMPRLVLPKLLGLAKVARQRLVDALPKTDPALAHVFAEAQYAAEAGSKFVRASGRFPLTAVGDVNTYALFAELARGLVAPAGRAGIVVPTGIATDDTTKAFFGDLVEKRTLASLYDFENREAIFPAVDSRMKFCLLTLSRQPVSQSQFVFFATCVAHLIDSQRRFTCLEACKPRCRRCTNTAPRATS